VQRVTTTRAMPVPIRATADADIHSTAAADIEASADTVKAGTTS
jgi:hypothetical protein